MSDWVGTHSGEIFIAAVMMAIFFGGLALAITIAMKVTKKDNGPEDDTGAV